MKEASEYFDPLIQALSVQNTQERQIEVIDVVYRIQLGVLLDVVKTIRANTTTMTHSELANLFERRAQALLN